MPQLRAQLLWTRLGLWFRLINQGPVGWTQLSQGTPGGDAWEKLWQVATAETCSGNKIPRTAGFKQQTLFLVVLEAWKPEVKVATGLVSGENPLPRSSIVSFAEVGREPSRVFSIKALISLIKALTRS